MNKISLILLIFICLSGCTSIPKVDHFIVTNFQQGLIQFDEQDEPFISQNGNQFPYAVNGSCVANGKRSQCMWHGFEFDYQSPEKNAEINCIGKSNRRQNQVYPDGIVAENTDIVRWSFTLPGYKGHYIRPQYDINTGKRAEPFQTLSKCYYKSEEIFKMSFTVSREI